MYLSTLTLVKFNGKLLNLVSILNILINYIKLLEILVKVKLPWLILAKIIRKIYMH
jgi:hypothetical protein